jgi:hypothetical protein
MIRHRVTAERIATGKGVIYVIQYVRYELGWLRVAEVGLGEHQKTCELALSLALREDAESTFIRFDDRHGIAVVRDAQAGVVAVAVYMPCCPAVKSLRRRLRALNAAYVASLSKPTAKEAA